MLTIMKTFLDLVQMLKFLVTKGQMELDESSSDEVLSARACASRRKP